MSQLERVNARIAEAERDMRGMEAQFAQIGVNPEAAHWSHEWDEASQEVAFLEWFRTQIEKTCVDGQNQPLAELNEEFFREMYELEVY